MQTTISDTSNRQLANWSGAGDIVARLVQHEFADAVGKYRVRFVLLAGVVCLLVYPAHADIAGTSGAMTPIFGPVSFLAGATESSTEIFILDEGITTLSAGIEVNAFGVGPHDGTAPPLLPVPAGTRVHSYLVHFDPAGGVVSLMGGVTFDPGEIILGIQTHTPLLYIADPIIAFPGVIYPAGGDSFRAFETLPGPDSVTIFPGLGMAVFSLIAELGMDQARIITIPEPSSLVLSMISLVGLMRLIRRPKRTAIA